MNEGWMCVCQRFLLLRKSRTPHLLRKVSGKQNCHVSDNKWSETKKPRPTSVVRSWSDPQIDFVCKQVLLALAVRFYRKGLFQGDNGVNLVWWWHRNHCGITRKSTCIAWSTIVTIVFISFAASSYLLTPPLCLPTAGSISQSFLRSLLWLIVYYVRVEKEIKEIIPYLCQSV